jgi:RHS repeat-associated protein
MSSSRKFVFSGNMPWFLRAVTILLIPVHLFASVSPLVVVAALSPAPSAPSFRSSDGSQLSTLDSQLPLLQPPASAFAQQAPSTVPHPPAIPKFDPPSHNFAFSADPTDGELITARCFEEPLVPLPGNPLLNENADLAQALIAFHQAPQDVAPLTAFLTQHPDSRWKASLLANLGLLYRSHGRWSKALAAFEDAWDLSKGATDPLLKAVADRVLGELAQLHARLGHMDRLETLFKETKDRDIRGAGTERVDGARSGLWLMKNDPGDAFRCGPFALGKIFQLLHPGQEVPKPIAACKSTTQGTNLATLEAVAHAAGLDYQAAFRSPGAPVIVPSVVNWKVGHFAALTKRVSACPEPACGESLDRLGTLSLSNGPVEPVERASASQPLASGLRPLASDEYLSQDPTFGVDTLISAEVLDAEASGYFLVPAGPLPPGWRAVDTDEARTIFGKGDAGPASLSPPPGKSPTAGGPGNPSNPNCGMAGYTFELASASLMLMDTPVGYTPPVGPAMKFTAHYNQNESADMTVVSNLGNKWSFDWISYIQASSDATTVIYGPGGGQLPYTGYNPFTGYFTAQTLSQDLLKQISPTSYVLYHKDGSQDVYNLSDGGATPHIFRTKSIDPQGNAIIYGYDNHWRLVTVTDALNQATVLSYGNSFNSTSPAFYNITRVTDPFGRFATFAYNNNGQLISITDVLGIKSQFTYGSGDFITNLTTPYGTTKFTLGNVNQYQRWLEATDPLGAQERVEFDGPSDGLSGQDSSAPSGFYNGSLNLRNTFFWDKKAMEEYVPGDYSKARITHFLLGSGELVVPIIESTKEPFENRVWYAYAGQPDTTEPGTSNQPTKVARILDDGTEQDYQYLYNAAGNVTQSIDPLGRETNYIYDTDSINLLQVTQKNGSRFDLLATYVYNLQHLPLAATDASGQKTTYTYNNAGQVRTVTDAKHETTTFWYNSIPTWTGTQPPLYPNATGYLVEIDGPIVGATTRFNYDGFGRVQAVTDSQGYTITVAYDVFDRPTMITYPDGTFTQTLYNRLDAEWIQDRLGRWTHQLHDPLRHLVAQEDSLQRKTSYDWCTCGALAGLTDPAGHTTTWLRDAQSRVTSKIYPDGTSLNYTYETTTSRLKSVTDAKAQVTNYSYNLDNSLAKVSYTNAQNPTPTVNYTYDSAYSRIITMTDGIGITNYTYNPILATPTLGSGLLATISGPLSNSTIAYTYDQLGRVLSTSINGSANTSSVVYDALGRMTSATNPLGTFGYTYVNQTGRVAQIAYPNGQVTNYSYYPNSAATPGNDDQRLQSITNLVPLSSQPSTLTNLSTFNYGYNAVGMITSWSKQLDASSALSSTFGYDSADQLISASVPLASGPTPQAYQYQYDLAGNRTSEQIGPVVTSSSYNNLNQLLSQAGGGNMVFNGKVTSNNNPVALTLAGQPATVDTSGNWRGAAPVTVGANSIPLVATDANGKTTTKTITIVVSGGANRTLTYVNGNLTNDGNGKTYTFDAANRMVSCTQTVNGVQTVTGYVYDGNGYRVQETLNGAVTKQWVWCGNMQPYEERDGSGNVTKRFYGMGEQIGGVNYYYTRDHQGSIREMTSSTGGLVARYDYDPYGRRTLVSGTDLADFGFTGFYYDQATGLNLTRFRFYDANLGRWLNRDPAGEDGGINLYAYVGNNPINWIDPFGLFHLGYTSNAEGASSVQSNGQGGLNVYIGTVPSGTSPIYIQSLYVHEQTHILDAYNQNSAIGNDQPAGLYLMPDTLEEQILTEINATTAQINYLQKHLNDPGCNKKELENDIKFVDEYRQVFYDKLLNADPQQLNGPPQDLWGQHESAKESGLYLAP